jgi:hypothetical protein
MGQITSTNVFDFMGTPADVRAQHTAVLTTLITNSILEVERIIGRKIETETFTNELFEDGRNCLILDNTLYLNGKYRDTYSITAISELGTTLNAVTDSNDGNDYYIDDRLGYIKRVNKNWSKLNNAVKISGKLGIVDSLEDTAPDLKQVLTEMVAIKSGLWKTYYNSEEFTVRELPAPSKEILDQYKLRYS